MGQYYRPVILDDENNVTAWLRCYDYDNGAKLMEHSYMGNEFVGAVYALLTDEPQRVVWCGDYADEVDYYGQTSEANQVNPEPANRDSFRFLVNQSKGLYIDLEAYKKANKPAYEYGGEDYYIDPLPLLTAMGNGRGGGDYRGTGPVGDWAGDALCVRDEKPLNYALIVPVFMVR